MFSLALPGEGLAVSGVSNLVDIVDTTPCFSLISVLIVVLLYDILAPVCIISSILLIVPVESKELIDNKQLTQINSRLF